MAETGDLAGRVAVVTGAGGGFGRAIGERLQRSGARIVAVDVEAALGALPGDWEGHAVDLGADDAAVALGRIGAALGTVDIVVANAGLVPPWRGVDALDAAEWQRVMAVNVWGVAVTLGAFVPAMARSEHASAVVMASINGYRAHPKQVLYTASKHAVIGVMRAAALDLGAKGIRVNALAPGPVATGALMGRLAKRHAEGQPSPDEMLAAMAAETALGRMVTAEDVANAAHFLASDASAGMTGMVLPVEAGLG